MSRDLNKCSGESKAVTVPSLPGVRCFAHTESPGDQSTLTHRRGAAVGSAPTQGPAQLWPGSCWGEPGAKQPSQAGPQPLGDTLCLQRFGWCGFAHSGVHSTESHPGGKFSTAAPCLCSSRGREVTPTQKYLKRILISHFIWIRICANFDGLNVTRPNFNCNQRALSDKSGCFIALFK